MTGRVSHCIHLASPSGVVAVGLSTLLLPAAMAVAGRADVLSATAQCSAASICTFAVTVRHADDGWSHYADRWEVVAPDGRVLATRVLRHPHLDEQPFTRSLEGVAILPAISQVTVRAHDVVHGFGGAEVTVRIDRIE